MNKDKIKELIFFIIKSAIFLRLASEIHIFTFILSVSVSGAICLLSFFLFPPDVLAYFIMWAFEIYFYSILMYFTAKKLGIIKTLDKSPLFIVIIILTIYELVLTFLMPYRLDSEHLKFYLSKDIYEIIFKELIEIGSFQHLHSFISVFLSYKFFRFLINKYPKLSWLKKFYPQKLETIITFKNFKKYTYDIIKTLTLKLIKYFKENCRHD